MTNKSIPSGRIVLLAAALFAVGPSFAQTPGASDVPPGLSKLQDAELRLLRLRLNEKDISIPADVRITLTFRKGGQISGRSAINSYGGIFTITPDGGVTIKVTTSTQMAGPAELMELEKLYFDGLSRVQKILLKPDLVVLEKEKTSLEFAFSPAR